MSRKIMYSCLAAAVLAAAASVLWLSRETPQPGARSGKEPDSTEPVQAPGRDADGAIAEQWLSELGNEEIEDTEAVLVDSTEPQAGFLCRVLAEKVKNRQSSGVIAVSRQVLVLGDRAVPDLVRLANSGDLTVESLAFGILIQIGTPGSMAAVLGRLLAAPTGSKERQTFLRQFSSVRESAVPQVLVKIMSESSDPSVKANIAEILSVMEGGAVVDAIIGQIESTVDPAQNERYAVALAQLAKPSNLAALDTALSTNSHPMVLWGSAMAAANVGNAQACELLARHAERNPELAELCAKALATVKSAYGQQALLNMLSNRKRNGAIRAAAVRALGNYNSSHVASELMREARTERDPAFRALIEEAAARIEQRLAETGSDGTKPGEMVETERKPAR